MIALTAATIIFALLFTSSNADITSPGAEGVNDAVPLADVSNCAVLPLDGDHQHGFDEAQCYQLPHSITVETGRIKNDDGFTKSFFSVVPAGSFVNSHLVYYRPSGREAVLANEWTFGDNVLGVHREAWPMIDSSPFLGLSTTTYPICYEDNPPTEVPDTTCLQGAYGLDEGGDDGYVIVGSKVTISMRATSDSCDVMRVITSATGCAVNRPPVCCGAKLAETVGWPPNHKFASIFVTGVTDPDGDAVTITITSVKQDEPVPGPGNPQCPDAQRDGSKVLVRRERDGSVDNGRVYTVSFEAKDGDSASCLGTLTYCIPHDQGGKKQCVDDGPTYDSFDTTGCSGF